MKKNFLTLLEQASEKAKEDYTAKLKKALIEKENFVVKTTQSGIGKIYYSKQVCEELNLTYRMLQAPTLEMMETNINDEIDNAVKDGVQVVFVEEIARMETSSVSEILSAFERKDIQVVMMYHFTPNTTTSLLLSDWIVGRKVKTLEYEVEQIIK